MKRNKFSRFRLFPVLFLLTLLVCAPRTLGLWQDVVPEASPGDMVGEPLPIAPAEPETPEEKEIPAEPLVPSQPIEERPAVEPQTKAEFFSDVLFIGDSRTVGISEYAGLSTASYFSSIGMSVYSVFDAQCRVGEKAYTLEQLLTEQTFGKIHLMLGINELGYDLQTTVEVYDQVVERIRTLQPDAVLYLGANLHVDAKRSQSDPTFNNVNLDKFNSAVAKLADGEKIVYLDVNPVFDDEQGNLAANYTGDGTHVYGSCYSTWGQWLYEAMCPAEMREEVAEDQ